MKKKHSLYREADTYVPLKKIFRTMKIALFVVLLSTVQILASSVYSQNTRFTLAKENVTIENVLSAIEDQSEFYFLYNGKLVDVTQKVKIKVENQNLEKTLNELLRNTNITHKIYDRQVVLSPIEGANSSQQQKSVSGKVTDSSGSPIPGVSVVVKGTTNGTISDANGIFSLPNIPENATLQFSFVGMKGQEVSILGKTTVNVSMIEDAIGIEEVVAIGYGSRAKRDVTSAISTVGSDQIGKAVSANTNMALQGRMTGVLVGDNSGNPAHAPKVRIRGVNTWGDSDPLYVIDGMPISDPKQGIYYEPLNIMNLVDPNDIESISVLKDASSAAIYGVRASNGVILITTKKGKSGEKIKSEFSSRFGIQNITQKLDLLNSEQYMNHVQKVWASDPTRPRDPSDVKYFDPSSPNYLGGSPTYDWQNAVKNKNAPTKDYSFRVSGGTEKSDYYLSLGSSGIDGTMIGSDFNRLSGNIKVNTRINEWIKVGVDYRIISTKHRNDQNTENLWRMSELFNTPPVQPIYGVGPNGFAPVVGGIQSDGTYNAEKLYGSGTSRNMNGIVSLNEGLNNLTRNLGFIYLTVEPIKNLTVKFQSSMDINNTKGSGIFDFRSSVFYYDAGDPRSQGGGNSVGSLDGTSPKKMDLSHFY